MMALITSSVRDIECDSAFSGLGESMHVLEH
jgi:hypothetical protein